MIAMALAGLINMAHARRRRQLFHDEPAPPTSSTIERPHAGLGHLVGGTAALAFAVALLASGALLLERRHATPARS